VSLVCICRPWLDPDLGLRWYLGTWVKGKLENGDQGMGSKVNLGIGDLGMES